MFMWIRFAFHSSIAFVFDVGVFKEWWIIAEWAISKRDEIRKEETYLINNKWCFKIFIFQISIKRNEKWMVAYICVAGRGHLFRCIHEFSRTDVMDNTICSVRQRGHCFTGSMICVRTGAWRTIYFSTKEKRKKPLAIEFYSIFCSPFALRTRLFIFLRWSIINMQMQREGIYICYMHIYWALCLFARLHSTRMCGGDSGDGKRARELILMDYSSRNLYATCNMWICTNLAPFAWGSKWKRCDAEGRHETQICTCILSSSEDFKNTPHYSNILQW